MKSVHLENPGEGIQHSRPFEAFRVVESMKFHHCYVSRELQDSSQTVLDSVLLLQFSV